MLRASGRFAKKTLSDIHYSNARNGDHRTNVNGTQRSQLFGNFVPDASQVSVVITIRQTLALGALMKQ
jgi:hypothetical protein